MKMTTGYMGLGLSIAASVLMFTGCGGGGGSSTPAAVAYNGKLIDSAVGGVSFVCGTVSGKTDANGVFGTCPAGSTATFSIGGLTLGSSTATGDGIFFLTDIVGVPRDDISNAEVLKIAVFLQSMDSDGDPTNGIDVPPEAAAIVDALPGTTTSIADLSAEQVVVLTTATVVELQVTYPDTTYVPIAEAEANLADSVEDIDNGTITPPSQIPTGSEGGS